MNNKIEMKMKKNQLTMLVLFVTMLVFGNCGIFYPFHYRHSYFHQSVRY